ncbi:MAG: beta-lactamase family protein [Lachnospiraceae bacterium]|nr:beta-lactamase family protein [Lachnospiraceae bacterium]
MQNEIKKVMDEAVARGEVAGCNALVISGGREIAYAESGYKNKENKTPFERDTIFRLYSMSKPITSAAVIMLMDRGMIDLADAVQKFIPSFKDAYVATTEGRVLANRPVTLRDLLNMASGAVYPGNGTAAECQSAALFDELIGKLGTDKEIGTVELAERIGKLDFDFQPGENFKYGTSADILGAVVEVVSGMRFGDFLKKEFFEPLGMADTDFWVPAEKRSRVADVYDTVNGEAKPVITDHLGINYKLDHRPAFESGGAGLCSTLDDYACFADMLMNYGEFKGRRLLSERAVRFMTNGSIAPWQQKGLDGWDGLTGYTYGNLLRVLRDPSRCLTFGEVGEYGWDGWLGAYFSNDPKNKLTILMGMQKFNAGTWNLTRKIRNLIYKEVK